MLRGGWYVLLVRWIAVILVAMCSAPLALAKSPGDDVSLVDGLGGTPSLPDQDIFRYDAPQIPSRAPFFFPCLTIDIMLEPSSTHVEKHVGQDVCDVPYVSLRWNATPFGGHGDVAFTFDAAQARDAPLPEAGSNLTSSRSSVDPAHPPPPPRIVVSAAFDAAWGGGCADARGSFSASVGGVTQPIPPPPGLFPAICLASTAGWPNLPADALAILVPVGRAAAPSVPAPEFGALVDALAVAAPAAPSAAIPPPDLSEVTRAKDGASGDGTLAAFDPQGLVVERHDVGYDTPVARGNFSGGFVIAPVETTLPLVVPQETEVPAVEPASPIRAEQAPLTTAHPASSAPRAPEPQEDRAGVARSASTAAPRVAPVARGTAAAAALAGAVSIAALLLLAASALYQRFAQPDALRHEGRAALARACRDLGRPANAPEIAAATGMARKTAEYHLLYLARAGILHVGRLPDGSRVFSMVPVPPDARPARAEAPLDEAILARIRERPGTYSTEVALALGVERRRVDRRIRDLLLSGLVTSRIASGRRRRLYAA